MYKKIANQVFNISYSKYEITIFVIVFLEKLDYSTHV